MVSGQVCKRERNKKLHSERDKLTQAVLWRCENAETCDSVSCLEKEPHKKMPWCPFKGRCDEKNIKVKCIRIE